MIAYQYLNAYKSRKIRKPSNEKSPIRLPRHSINSGSKLLVIAMVYGNNAVNLRHIYDRILTENNETC